MIKNLLKVQTIKSSHAEQIEELILSSPILDDIKKSLENGRMGTSVVGHTIEKVHPTTRRRWLVKHNDQLYWMVAPDSESRLAKIFHPSQLFLD